MKESELLKKLNSLNVQPKFYSIDWEIKDYAHNIERLYNGQYAVYARGRGEKIGVRIFDTEKEALAALIES